jgi:hypothetical protein
MRLLVLSEIVCRGRHFKELPYRPPYDVELEVGDLNETMDFSYSVFDYDVSIIHITEPRESTIGYYENLPKLCQDAAMALENGRSIICLPQSRNFTSETLRAGGTRKGMRAYEWLGNFGVELQDNEGVDIRPSGAGRAQVVQDYLKYAPKYYQIVTKPEVTPERRLAVVDDTEIIVGAEHQVGKGTLVILPPPILDQDHYLLRMGELVRVARRYYERAQRYVPVGDAPDWLEGFLVARARDLDAQINKLANEKAKYDRLAYVLYGTGEELESSVALLLEQFGLDVEHQPSAANIDLKAKHPGLNIGFAVEVTGTKGTIKKGSTKIAQAWQHLSDRSGTPEEKDRLIIVANTQYHLDPRKRSQDGFSQNVVRLLGGHEVLLITTLQLYEQWKEVHEGNRSTEELIQELHSSHGLFRKTRS